ncbi:ycf3-interacting protein 1, chloroplastic [Prosopis cineraria]|uniref:ycf3-interacting protein 1, chloroplastic n=1 Tax=Prosopis cineraria TaxID=364024 RepID=UPI00240EE1D8|nr:ycf3-interacting protein 1, chloroplastic [Prosopis cineraria]
MASQLLPLSFSSSSSSCLPKFVHRSSFRNESFSRPSLAFRNRQRQSQRSPNVVVPLVGKEDTELRVSSEQDEDADPTAEDLEYINQVKTVLELLRTNRDMLFGEVKLTIMIEDPREVERRRLLGIEDPDAPTRDDLVAVLEEVNEGKIPKNKAALKMLAEELNSWPNLEAEALKTKPSKSLYARATDTGIDPKEAAKRLNVDWDSAAEIEDSTDGDDTEVPPAVGYGALYLVTAFPVIIGISVVLILFFNSLQ